MASLLDDSEHFFKKVKNWPKIDKKVPNLFLQICVVHWRRKHRKNGGGRGKGGGGKGGRGWGRGEHLFARAHLIG